MLYNKTTNVMKARSSHRRCSVKKDVLRNFAKFTGKHQYQSLFFYKVAGLHLCQGLSFNKVAGLRPATLLKKRLWHRCFPVNFAKFLRISFLQNTSGRLLLESRQYICNYFMILICSKMFGLTKYLTIGDNLI